MDMETDEVFTPRPYQDQLEEIAIKKNTIIHLPTGSGKTFIAIRLITRFREALKKPWGQGGKRTFFLVNTIPLVEQQRRVIKKLCPVEGVGAYSGKDRVDYWNKEKWDSELSMYQVVVMTSQILSDMLTHRYIQIEDINLLIFDECHHAVDDHPMRLVMKHFEDCPKHKQPRVLGLTATLLNANAGSNYKIEDTLTCLETTFHATIATVNELGEVLEYSTNPQESVLYYRPVHPTAAALEAIEILQLVLLQVADVDLPRVNDPAVKIGRNQHDITSDPKKIVKAVKNMITAMTTNIKELGVYGGSISILAYTILLERLKGKAVSKEEQLLYRVVINMAIMARDVLETSMENDLGYEKIVKHSSEQVLQMLSVLKEYSPNVIRRPGVCLTVNRKKKPLSGIIFTRQRFTAKILYNILKEVKKENPEEFGFLQADFIVGFNVNPFNNTREQYLSKKISETALLKFGNKELNCLISTSVIEEGVDIPQCLLVLRYDPPLEYRSYIQSKGRARSNDASYVILVKQENRAKFEAQYKSFQSTEQYIQKLLVGSSEDRNAPTQFTIQRELYSEDEIPPYVSEYGNRLSAVQAISLLNRYCLGLPHDQFTTITPKWLCEKIHDTKNDIMKPVITIIMPIACPVKEPIQGQPCFNLKSAKRSAALNACIRLYQEGELDANTMLPKRYGSVNFEQEDVKTCFPNWPWDEPPEENELLPKPGTKKRLRKHNKVFAPCLDGPTDWKFGQKTFYLHVLKLKTAFAMPTESREVALYNFLQQSEGYGFLTANQLPDLCEFPMYLTVGEVTTSLEVNYATVPIDKDLFELVKRFHLFLYSQVIGVAKKFTVFDGSVNCMYTVPVNVVNGRHIIDWDTVRGYTEIRPVAVPTYEERRRLQVSREAYKHAVVTPWYRSSIEPDRYIVSDVLEYLTPLSRFSKETYEHGETYDDYYNNKYNLQVVGRKDQPLLEVRNISSRMNCLMPRAATLKSLTDKQKKLVSAAQGDDRPKKFEEVFIPEYCIKYEYPGVLWYKATMLPSVIHRIFMLLVADELRVQIATETKIGHIKLPKGQSWKPIESDIHVATKALLSQVESPAEINTIDRINNPIDESAPRPKVLTMKEAVYQLQKKKINNEYPWDEQSEPIDIERNILSVTLMDIECYDEFVSTVLAERPENVMRSPARAATAQNHLAILAPPLRYVDKIALLSNTPSGRGPELRDILRALTTIKSGDCFNLERLETLGDSFLKFAATLYLFHKFPGLNEGQLSNVKSRLIGNRNLYYAGERVNIGGRMKAEHFSPRKDFLMPGFFAPAQLQDFIEKAKIRPTFLIGMEFDREEVLEGKLSAASWSRVLSRYHDDTGEVEVEPLHDVQAAMQSYVRAQVLSDKSVADCVEALIGTYLLSCGIPGAVKFLEWLRVLPKQDDFLSYLHKSVPTPVSLGKATQKDIDFLLNDCREDIEKKLEYRFRDATFLLEALSHPSYIRNRQTCSYERLEFLGDAILDFLVTAHVFENSRDLKPGELTDLRSALVNNVTFASYVVKLGLHKFVCTQFNPCLDHAIMSFVEHQEQRDHEIVEDVLTLIDEEDCHVAEYVEVPKILSDIFESLAGAIYLDSGGDLEAVWRVYYRIMCREIDAFSANIPKQPVRMLYECIHACASIGDAMLTNTEIPKVMVPVTVSRNGSRITVHGFGNNKFQAKRAAAKIALKILGISS